ncbi:MAG: methyltransferase [Actinophytocola sp.]|uniref:methyltransferase n=1 Tax=Actinophytocola sp. TaxID=1872138 RepID=UPI003C752D7A
MSSATGAGASPPWPTVLRLVFGGMATHVFALAVRLRLPDAIGDGERDAADLAAEFGVQEGPMLRLLRGLASLDVLTEPGPGRFALTAVGGLLRRDQPGSMYPLARMLTDPMMATAWQNLEFSLRTGGPAFDKTFGTDFFGYLAEHPDLSQLYNSAMSHGTRGIARTIADEYDFGRHDLIVDVGGGDGTTLTEILTAHPGPRGVVYDTPTGVAGAVNALAAAGLTARCQVRTGDFFSEVPPAADLYLLKSVLHGWDDEQAAVILRNCARDAAKHGRVLVVEHLLPDTVPPPNVPPGAVPSEQHFITYLNDLNLLVNGRGRERTHADFAALCAEAGLRLDRTSPLTTTNFHCIEISLD